MCNISDDRKPEQKLADLMQRELDAAVDPVALRLFVRHYWSRISGWAHAIHEGAEPSAPAPNHAKIGTTPAGMRVL